MTFSTSIPKKNGYLFAAQEPFKIPVFLLQISLADDVTVWGHCSINFKCLVWQLLIYMYTALKCSNSISKVYSWHPNFKHVQFSVLQNAYMLFYVKIIEVLSGFFTNFSLESPGLAKLQNSESQTSKHESSNVKCRNFLWICCIPGYTDFKIVSPLPNLWVQDAGLAGKKITGS